LATETCQYCGSQLEPQHKFCPVCGKRRSSAHISDRIPTGIIGEPSLDNLLEGGFEQGKTYLVAGETGTGKTIFSLQYLLDGIKRNEPGIYVTIDERPERLVQDTERFGWMLEHHVRDHRLLILPVRQYFTTKMWGRDMDVIVNAIVTELKKRSRQVNARRLVIDPVAPLVATYTTELSWTREYIRSLVFTIEKEITTTNIITSEVPTGEGGSAISRYGVEEFLASGIIVLGLSKLGNEIVRSLYVRKMRWTNTKPAIYRFDIERNRGIVLKGPLPSL